MRRLFAFLMMAVALPAGAQQAAEKLGIGDTVHVTVFQQPDLTLDSRVTERGTLTLPLVGEVKVAGMTTGDAGTQIAEEYKRGKFLKEPKVTVALTAVKSRQVSVLGLIARPGRYVLEDAKPTVPDVIAAAGGIIPGGGEQVTVIREGASQKVSAVSKDFELKSGDTINVERSMFYIYGEVTRSGTYPLTANLTVMQAISLGGGITARGSDRRIKLRRAGPDGKVSEYNAKLSDAVRPDDVIFVREALF